MGRGKKNQIDYFNNRYLGTNLENPNFADVAKAMGAKGITVDDVDESAMRAWRVKSNKPTVINLMLTRELGDPVPPRCVQAAEALAGEIQKVQRERRIAPIVSSVIKKPALLPAFLFSCRGEFCNAALKHARCGRLTLRLM